MQHSRSKVQQTGCRTGGSRPSTHPVTRQESRRATNKECERFEELPVWQLAIELAVNVYALTGKVQFRRRDSLRDQIERVAVSISSHIAEGFERGTRQETLAFLYIARGSAGEVRSLLCLIARDPAFTGLESEISNLRFKAEAVSEELSEWVEALLYSGAPS
jgi:four helix bundle protein